MRPYTGENDMKFQETIVRINEGKREREQL